MKMHYMELFYEKKVDEVHHHSLFQKYPGGDAPSIGGKAPTLPPTVLHGDLQKPLTETPLQHSAASADQTHL